MGHWDSPAAARLATVVADLEERGVIQVVRDLTDRVWRANLQRYEPRELGDTTRWLGMSAAGDLTQLVGRHYTGADAHTSTGVVATWPDGALVLRTGHVRIHLMKAPASPLRTPAWRSFTWSAADSRSRLLAARRNSTQYAPAASDQDGRPSMLNTPDAHDAPDAFSAGDPQRPAAPASSPVASAQVGAQSPLWAPSEDPSTLTEMMLVWSGEPEQAVTAGWLGIPCLGPVPWFAVAPLWWDEAGAPVAGQQRPTSPEGKDDAFSARPLPQLQLGLKRPAATPATPTESTPPLGAQQP